MNTLKLTELSFLYMLYDTSLPIQISVKNQTQQNLIILCQ